MFKFDEEALLQSLLASTLQQQAAFALAAATRQLTSFERVARLQGWPFSNEPRSITVDLWNVATTKLHVDATKWRSTLEDIFSWIPTEDDESWNIQFAFVQDCLYSLCYCVRLILSGDPQEAVWAAKSAYEAADQAAIRVLHVDISRPEVEHEILAHGIVQRELKRQNDAVLRIQANELTILRDESFAQEHLTDVEAASVN